MSWQREILLALLLALCYGLFIQQPAWNEYSRYDLIVAVVDDQSLQIDRYHQNTGDKALFDGHYYSDKVPGTAILGVPVYALLRFCVAQGWVLLPDPPHTIAILAFIVSGLPTIVLVLLLARFLRPLVGEWWALALATGYGLGSIAFPFATMLFGHAASTCCLFAAFFLLSRADARGGPKPALWAGALAGWAVLTDLPALLAVGALLVYAWSRERRWPTSMVLGALPAALLLLGYNWLAFGAPFSLGYANLANQGFAGGMGRGLLGVTAPRWETLAELIGGPRGLLRLSPWLALAPLGLFAARRPAVRREVILCGVIVGAFLLVNAGYYLPFGGWTPGPRFLLPALPFATVLVALVPHLLRPLVALQLLFATALCCLASATMPNAPEAVRNPLSDLWLPRLLSRNLAQSTAWSRWGLHGLQPLFLLGGAATITLLALYATTHRGRWAQRAVYAGIAIMAALVLALGTPLTPPTARSLFARSGATDDAGLQIVDLGTTLLPTAAGRPTVVLWSQIANDGESREHTAVTFTVYAPNGQQVWASGHSDVAWRGRERKQTSVQWTPTPDSVGEYRIEVSVAADDGQPLSIPRRDPSWLYLPH